jgi:putative aldouronate transport system permease protein
MNNHSSKIKKSTAVKYSAADKLFMTINGVVMSIITVLILYPLYYVLVASLTDPDIVNTGKFLLYPEKLFLDGYIRIFQIESIWRGYANTLLYTTAGTIVSLILTVPAAYVLSRKDLGGRKIIMLLIIFTMFFQGGLIPLFLVIKKVQIYNTIWAIILPHAVSVWNLIICRSFFASSIPDELLEASRIDGAKDFGFLFRIVLPLSKTIIAVMTLFSATALWNSYFPALMFLRDSSKMPLQVILRDLIIVNQVAQMAGDVEEMERRMKLADQLKYGIILVSTLPMLILYPFVQKYFVKGVMVGSVKG